MLVFGEICVFFFVQNSYDGKEYACFESHEKGWNFLLCVNLIIFIGF